MKVQCVKCGFHNEGNFCSNCGATLSPPHSPAKREAADPAANESWLDKCPVCKLASLSPVARKKLLGLVTTESIECAGCGASFTRRGERYQLSEVRDTSEPVWQEYGKQTLMESEWRNIAHGAMSDARQRDVDMEHWMTELKQGKIMSVWAAKRRLS